jgi:hypothetical protein
MGIVLGNTGYSYDDVVGEQSDFCFLQMRRNVGSYFERKADSQRNLRYFPADQSTMMMS